MRILRYILLLTPFNVLAHPGHDELLIQLNANDWLYAAVWLLPALATGAVIGRMKSRRKRLKSIESDD